MKKIILVDMDNVLADYESAFLEQYRAKFPHNFYIPLKDRKRFYVHEEYPQKDWEDVRTIYNAPGFFANLPVIEGGKEALEEMKELGFDVFICSSPVNKYQYCVPEKYAWVEKNLGFEWTKKIIMTKDKTLVYGDMLIDDKPEHKGLTIPPWEHILYDAPYNRNVTDKKRVTWDNWKEVVVREELGNELRERAFSV